MPVSLALIATGAGLLLWWMDGRMTWLAGAMVMCAVIPFMLIVIRPTNQCLLDAELDRSSEATRLLQTWGRLHAVRGLLSLAEACLFLSAVIRS